MKLLSIGIANYRSFGETPVMIDLSRRVTVLIGANNSGKSNVLAGLVELSDKNWAFVRLGATDLHQRRANAFPRLVFEAEVELGDRLNGFLEGQRLRFTREFDGSMNGCWIEHPLSSLSFEDLSRLLRETTGEDVAVNNVEDLRPEFPDICAALSDKIFDKIAGFHFIPQYRQIQESAGYEVHGAGIVELLASWQHPEIGKDASLQLFSQIEGLLQNLLHDPSVRLEVSHDKKTIIVQRDGLRLPLHSYGTGIHQVIILAVAVISRDNVVFCIEEPEIHLHPTLQREFMRFLVQETRNRYVITTHSPALIDPGPDVAVVHLELSSHTTTPRLLHTPLDTLAVLRDLGIRPSDLLQANAVIWVEGPSDRIYLKHWLGLMASDLVEGIHFSVMFYGGRLLSHLALDRSEEASELVSLLRIAQNSAVIIDSDKRRRQQSVNATKRRVQSEGEAAGAYVWITEGREIENLLPCEAVAGYYAELTGTRPIFKLGPFDSLEEVLELAYGRFWRPKYSYNEFKPERARGIARFINLDMLSPAIRKRLNDLVDLIRSGPQLRQAATKSDSA